METTLLSAFVAVAETGSFSRAAEKLFLTQPAVSKRILSLEEQLDARLFDRIGRQVRMTEAGSKLYGRATRILQEIEDSQRAIKNLSGKVEGRLSIATSHHIGLHRLPEVLKRYGQKYPLVRLDLHFLGSESACAAVRSGEVELGIVTLADRQEEQILAEKIWDDPLAVVVSPNNPDYKAVLGRGDGILPRELAAFPAILPGKGTFTRQMIDEAFGAFGTTIPVKMTTDYLETIKMLVAVGLGWSVLPLSMLTESELDRVEVKGITLGRSLGLVQHQERTLSNAAAQMIDLLKENANPS